MPALATHLAAEKLAQVVEGADPRRLGVIYAELFPEQPVPAHLRSSDIASHIRTGLVGEEIVDLWNVLFPESRNVWYDAEEQVIRYDSGVVEYAD